MLASSGAQSTNASISTNPQMPNPSINDNNLQDAPNSSGSRYREDERSLWASAYAFLQIENPRLVQKFEHCLGISATDNDAEIDGLAQKALEKIGEAQDSGEKHESSLQKYTKKAIELIIASKDFISSAASVEPHAALAWAGVSLLLPVSYPQALIVRTYTGEAPT